MRIATIQTTEGVQLALHWQGKLLDIGRVAEYLEMPGFEQKLTDLISDVIENPERQKALRELHQLLEKAENVPLEQLQIDGEIVWLPPVKRPGKILGVAMNNKASDERKISAPSHPAFFLKPSSCLIGHGQAIEVRDYYGSVHPEPELALIIGKRVRDVSAEDAWGAIYGYTVFNDITGNDMRAEDRFHYWALYPKADNPEELE